MIPDKLIQGHPNMIISIRKSSDGNNNLNFDDLGESNFIFDISRPNSFDKRIYIPYSQFNVMVHAHDTS